MNVNVNANVAWKMQATYLPTQIVCTKLEVEAVIENHDEFIIIVVVVVLLRLLSVVTTLPDAAAITQAATNTAPTTA